MQLINLKKISGKGAVRAGKGFALFISNGDMNGNIKITKSLDHLVALIDWVTEALKNEIKIQEGGFLGALLASSAASILQPVISAVVKGISGRGARKAKRGYTNKMF